MSATLRVNGKDYAIAMVRGRPRIDGLSTKAFIQKMKRQKNFTELKSILDVAMQVTAPSLLLPRPPSKKK